MNTSAEGCLRWSCQAGENGEKRFQDVVKWDMQLVGKMQKTG